MVKTISKPFSAQYIFTPEFHTRKEEYFTQAIRCQSALNKLGKTSIELFKRLYSTRGNILLCTCLHTIVFVDAVKRNSSQLPDYVHEKLGKVIAVVKQPRFKAQLRPKSGYHRTSYKVTWSDIDFQYHMNQAEYIRVAINAATEACFSGKLKGFENDLGRYCTKGIKTLYTAECSQGDNLNIFTWVDQSNECILHSQIEKQDGTTAFHAQFYFYTNEELFKSRI